MAGLIALIVFLAMLATLAAVWHTAMAPRYALQERIGRYVELEPAVREAAGESFGVTLTGWRAVVRNMSRYFVWSGRSRALERKLVQAGLPLKGAEFAAICAGTTIVTTAGMFMIGRGHPAAVLIGVVLGCALPVLVLYIKAAKRVSQFNDQLADALILVANSLRTGYSFLQAVEMVSREMAPPIGVEFARLLKEMNLGVTTEDALANMGGRVGSDDLDLVITAVLIQRQVGGNLAEVLDNIAGTIRARIKLRGEVKTLTAQGRISGLVIGALPIALALMIFVINPSYIGALFTHPAGRLMVLAAVVSDAIGMMLVWRIVNIKY